MLEYWNLKPVTRGFVFFVRSVEFIQFFLHFRYLNHKFEEDSRMNLSNFAIDTEIIARIEETRKLRKANRIFVHYRKSDYGYARSLSAQRRDTSVIVELVKAMLWV